MKHCCKDMKEHLKFSCDIHRDKFECPDTLVTYSKKNGYGIIIHDGGDSYITIKFCPWCGKSI